MKNTIDVAIIGGGFAGLAAAVRLAKAGKDIHLFEKKPFLGGRAYSFRERATGHTVDNGQHLLMGCYHETFKFLNIIGSLDKLDFQKALKITFSEGDAKKFILHCPDFPAPLHLAWGLLSCKGLKLKDKWAMTRLVRYLKKTSSTNHDLTQMSVADLLKKTAQTTSAIKKFWEPICLATVNESIEIASAKLFREVLVRSLLSNKTDSRLVVSKVGLSDLYVRPAQKLLEDLGASISLGTTVKKIQRSSMGFLIETEQGSALQAQQILCAIPPKALSYILHNSKDTLGGLQLHLDLFKESPILSINLWFEDLNLGEKMLGLIESPIHWVFNKALILREEQNNYLSLVISGAHQLANHSKEELVYLALLELQHHLPQLDPKKLRHAQIIRENQATFSANVTIEKHRPSPQTSVQGLFVAGDWTDTGLPATIEGAVLSGHRAANLILGDS